MYESNNEEARDLLEQHIDEIKHYTMGDYSLNNQSRGALKAVLESDVPNGLTLPK
jgi:hypothetical protein